MYIEDARRTGQPTGRGAFSVWHVPVGGAYLPRRKRAERAKTSLSSEADASPGCHRTIRPVDQCGSEVQVSSTHPD
eukprot:604886-Prorocentrum_minimum.AAC.1